jgi:hypothetical protein
MKPNIKFNLVFDTPWPTMPGAGSRSKIHAIRLVRTALGLGLKESKDVVERRGGSTFLTTAAAFGHLYALLQVIQDVDGELCQIEIVDPLADDVIDLT